MPDTWFTLSLQRSRALAMRHSRYVLVEIFELQHFTRLIRRRHIATQVIDDLSSALNQLTVAARLCTPGSVKIF
jgi:hypothetical protein